MREKQLHIIPDPHEFPSRLKGKTFISKARIDGFEMKTPWFTALCPKCPKQISKKGSTWFCTTDSIISSPSFTSSALKPTMENLPCEVLLEIFVRLLAKQLAQMRCVCKSWNALLSESSFIKSHLHHSLHNKDEILLFFRMRHGSFIAHPSSSPDLELANFIKFPWNAEFEYAIGIIIGSVNGLVSIYQRSYLNYVVFIWNPSLSVSLTLPPYSSPSPASRELYDTFGFGYDPKTDDYKVVKITRLSEPPNMALQAGVYSMRKGSWESISQTFSSHVTRLTAESQFFPHGRDGHICWIGSVNANRKLGTIVSFDVGEETFTEIPLMDNSMLQYHVYRDNGLGVLAGKLCVISIIKYDRCDCEVWVMDKYGVAESWVKQYVFPLLDHLIFSYGFTSRNEFLFQYFLIDRVVMYNPVASKNKIFKIITGQGHRSPVIISKVIEYMDSLVWITPAKQLHI
ncbi:hypothetical protein LXL04_022176 [Taraxacum kok-saghyz]